MTRYCVYGIYGAFYGRISQDAAVNHVVPGLHDRLGSLGRRAEAARGVFHVAAARDEKQAKAYLLMLKAAE